MSERRRPLSTLPLSRFIPVTSLIPSPSSIPIKRRPSTPAESNINNPPPSPGRVRAQCVAEEEDVMEHTVKRRRKSDLTPRAIVELEKPVFGLGRSPARRLFGQGDSPINSGSPNGTTSKSGSGNVVFTAPKEETGKLSPSPSIDLTSETSRRSGVIDSTIPVSQHSTRSHSTHTSSTTAPSTPSTPFTPSRLSTQPGMTKYEDIHDPGFTILADSAPSAPLTPRSKTIRNISEHPDLSLDAQAHLPSSPTSTIWEENDQENIAPARNGEDEGTPKSKAGMSKGEKGSPKVRAIAGLRGGPMKDGGNVQGSPSRTGRSKLSHELELHTPLR
ncbi:hypothetical protein M231_01940 [Tremella mesenterica]|uniref:Uncharacterized protein n=1 Tax=Tremella mesenterica TaxID=5217 RepID=A0A4Q1BRU5_TREME|nr:uncharacterized protein TREMEDRAFT_59595 [Tremella mesenterica DSM 1558]EIW73430.1 hypothetical protein TREMEDRAFT_59595 [Tremella mesenterica DSM 1558]RXK40689.1 hypothetical protein M231_01940 [Tremella mesenterica]